MSFFGLALILFGCSFIQGAAGFGFGIFAVPLFVWAGLGLVDAVTIVAVTSLIQVAVGAFTLRKNIKWREVFLASFYRILALPLGVFLLVAVDNLDEVLVKQLLGAILLAILAAQVLLRIEPREHLHPFWRVFAFSASGIMMGMVSMGGPPGVLWVMAQRWSNRATRGFLMSIFLFSIPVHLALLYAAYGGAALLPARQGLLFLPVVAVGAWLGVGTGNILPKARLRQVAYSLLFVTACSSLFAHWLS